jgi:hypothetical protein
MSKARITLPTVGQINRALKYLEALASSSTGAGAGAITADSTTTFSNKTISGSNNTISIGQSSVTALVSDLAGKQSTLVSGTSIKTINNTSVLGSGNIAVGDVTLTGTETLTNKTLTSAILDGTTVIPSTSAGLQIYNTSDQVTNYGRLIIRNPTVGTNGLWEIAAQNAGSATRYGYEFAVAGSSSFRMGGSSVQGNTDGAGVSFYPQLANVAGRQGVSINAYESLASGSGLQSLFCVFGKVDQVGTAGYRSIWISPFENTTGSGIKYLIDAGINTAVAGTGTHTSKFTVSNVGVTTATQFAVSALNTAPSSATDTGTAGEIRVTATYIYICTATNTWVRTALATW